MSIAWLVGLAIVNHSALTAIRIAASLHALSLGASPLEVGTVIALFALLPAVVSIREGRVADRHNAHRLMLEGTVGVGIGTALPALWQSLPMLYACAVIVGLSFLRFHLALQSATGDLDGGAERIVNFSKLSLGFSTSAFAGPLLAGIAIDTGGYRAAFVLIALLPLIALAVLVRYRRARSPPRKAEGEVDRSRFLSLLVDRRLRFVFMASALSSMGWDLHAFFVPVYGTRIGLSASQSGAILSSFAAATFVVRLLMGRAGRQLGERRVIQVALALASLVYFVYPFFTRFEVLAALSFVLGLGLGASQPVVMSLIHSVSPRGRAGEVTGVRQTIINTTQFAMPLLFGAVGTATGMVPLFWAVGALLAAGSWVAKGR